MKQPISRIFCPPAGSTSRPRSQWICLGRRNPLIVKIFCDLTRLLVIYPGMRYSYGPPARTNGLLSNQYNPQLLKAGLQVFPRPDMVQLAALTAQVALNNRFAHTQSASDAAVMAAVRQGVKHVIFIIKERWSPRNTTR